MPVPKDLRDYLDAIESIGQLKRIKAQVDWDLEIGTVLYEVMKGPNYAVLFENIKGCPKDFRFLANTWNSIERVNLMYGLPVGTSPNELIQERLRREETPLEPKILADGPCKENVLKGRKVNLLKFPNPRYHYMIKRYFGTNHGVITRDPETGIRNVGMYRMMLHDERTLGFSFGPAQGIVEHLRKAEARKEPLPIAITCGQSPLNVVCGATAYPKNLDEYTMVGALQQKPLELVKCETIPLEVPASAEIVIEGEVPPGVTRTEGPFTEYPGCTTGVVEAPIVNVKCITHRNAPIQDGGFHSGPYDAYMICNSVNKSVAAWNTVRRLGRTDVRAISFCPWSTEDTLVVAIDKRYAGQAYDVAEILLSSLPFTKNAIVVDNDIDPWKIEEVLWAFNTRVLAGRDIRIARNVKGSYLDTAVPPSRRGLGDRMIVDATWPVMPEDDFPPRAEWNGMSHPPLSIPRPQDISAVKARWKEYGLD
jgi:4-hydroxy-3-polyprenylbenzoate decarboxylase